MWREETNEGQQYFVTVQKCISLNIIISLETMKYPVMYLPSSVFVKVLYIAHVNTVSW